VSEKEIEALECLIIVYLSRWPSGPEMKMFFQKQAARIVTNISLWLG
jgi:hypothetical protein